MRDSDLHPLHWSGSFSLALSSSAVGFSRVMTKVMESCLNSALQVQRQLFEVLDMDRVFLQIVFAKNILTCLLFSFFMEVGVLKRKLHLDGSFQPNRTLSHCWRCYNFLIL